MSPARRRCCRQQVSGLACDCKRILGTSLAPPSLIWVQILRGLLCCRFPWRWRWVEVFSLLPCWLSCAHLQHFQSVLCTPCACQGSSIVLSWLAAPPWQSARFCGHRSRCNSVCCGDVLRNTSQHTHTHTPYLKPWLDRRFALGCLRKVRHRKQWRPLIRPSTRAT